MANGTPKKIKPIKGYWNVYTLMGLIISPMTIYPLVGAHQVFDLYSRYQTEGVEMEASVTVHDINHLKNRDDYVLYYAYLDSNNVQHGGSMSVDYSFWNQIPNGGKVPIVYLKDDPSQSMVQGSTDMYTSGVWMLRAGIFFTAATAGLLGTGFYIGSRNTAIREQGRSVTATITDISTKTIRSNVLTGGGTLSFVKYTYVDLNGNSINCEVILTESKEWKEQLKRGTKTLDVTYDPENSSAHVLKQIPVPLY